MPIAPRVAMRRAVWRRNQARGLRKSATCCRPLSTVSSLYPVPRGLASDDALGRRPRETGGIAVVMAANERDGRGVSPPTQLRGAPSRTVYHGGRSPTATVAAYVRDDPYSTGALLNGPGNRLEAARMVGGCPQRAG